MGVFDGNLVRLSCNPMFQPQNGIPHMDGAPKSGNPSKPKPLSCYPGLFKALQRASPAAPFFLHQTPCRSGGPVLRGPGTARHTFFPEPD